MKPLVEDGLQGFQLVLAHVTELASLEVLTLSEVDDAGIAQAGRGKDGGVVAFVYGPDAKRVSGSVRRLSIWLPHFPMGGGAAAVREMNLLRGIFPTISAIGGASGQCFRSQDYVYRQTPC